MTAKDVHPFLSVNTSVKKNLPNMNVRATSSQEAADIVLIDL